MRSLHWFREDLRISDNTSLYHAINQADEGCITVYFITPKTWQDHDMAACRVDFILRGLQLLQNDLNTLHLPLLVLEVSDFSKIPAALLQLCTIHHIKQLHFNIQYEINELKRDQAVRDLLTQHGIQVSAHHDQTIIPPEVIRTHKNAPYTVFTPFKKAWIDYYQHHPVALLPRPQAQPLYTHLPASSPIPKQISGFVNPIDPALWPAGEQAALSRLKYFIENSLVDYKEKRDQPAVDGTSQLSPYLASGMISARVCLQAALEFNEGQLDKGHEGALLWMSELVWREFYKTILVNFPRVCMHKPFKLITEKLRWDENEKLLNAWKTGQTGYPIIDAAMRQLLCTGWMHNRLRMIVAMFFSKQLWLDWRVGEKFFMQHLIDGDLSANNGGWQWSASTGNDAAPYFRIFNPYTQSERFDPEGEFIKYYCPELADLDAKSLHQPYGIPTLFMTGLNYPAPIVDYKTTRERAIVAFKNLNAME